MPPKIVTPGNGAPEPVRVRLSRAAGWRMPPNTVSVARPGKWGNPYDVALYGRERAIALFAETAHGRWSPQLIADADSELRGRTFDAHQAWLERIGGDAVRAARAELRGRNLACWCTLDQACHADVLLEIANG